MGDSMTDPKGTEAQAEAYGDATDVQWAYLSKIDEAYKQMMEYWEELGKPMLEMQSQMAEQLYPALTSKLLEPTETTQGRYYDYAAGKSADRLASSLAHYGLTPSSKTYSSALGESLGLLGAEEARTYIGADLSKMGMMGNLLSGAPNQAYNLLGSATGLLSGMGGAYSNLSNLYQQTGNMYAQNAQNYWNNAIGGLGAGFQAGFMYPMLMA